MPWNESWPVWCEIRCSNERCFQSVAGRFCCGRLEKVKIRNAAKTQGWKLIDNKWFCKGCNDDQL